MNGNEGLTASDVALLAGNNNDGFGGNGWGRHDLAVRNSRSNGRLGRQWRFWR